MVRVTQSAVDYSATPELYAPSADRIFSDCATAGLAAANNPTTTPVLTPELTLNRRMDTIEQFSFSRPAAGPVPDSRTTPYNPMPAAGPAPGSCTAPYNPTPATGPVPGSRTTPYNPRRAFPAP
ncbi:uncharacterized protein LOC121871732 [Homarus americanus]|uniref:uncharacterized protein LOC121871732 n=1 Tax=Homarus americanus TaxID=6706 RepID=UPI001C43BA84|nr:uncharacterized protein LOC121871732 [Homarus americanus]